MWMDFLVPFVYAGNMGEQRRCVHNRIPRGDGVVCSGEHDAEVQTSKVLLSLLRRLLS